MPHEINVHGLGFIQIPLPGNQRLHVWHPDVPRRSCYEHSNIHNHRWSFNSRVLVGSLKDKVYDVRTADEEPAHDDPNPATHTAFSHEGERRPSGCRPWIPIKYLSVKVCKERIIEAGEDYDIHAYDFHNTEILTDKVATLIRKTKFYEPPAWSLCALGIEPNADFDRYQLAPMELWSIVTEVLGREPKTYTLMKGIS